MRITAKISHYHKGPIAFVLAPFLWLQMYFHELEEWLASMIYDELFKNEEQHYDQNTHLYAFFCFSGFCLLANYKQIEQYTALILYGLWLINYLSVKFKAGLYIDKPAWVRLELREENWQWILKPKNEAQTSQTFAYSDVLCVLIAATTYSDSSFKNQVLQVWHIHIQTKDQQQWVVYQEAKIQNALTRAHTLASQFNTRIKIADSYGTGSLAEIPLNANAQTNECWRKRFIGSQTEIYKNFSTISLLNWIKALVSQVGDFVFIAVLAGVMERYGALLMLFLGPKLGLNVSEPVYIDLSPAGLLKFFRPDFNWVLVLVFAVTFAALLHSIYRQSRHLKLVVDNNRLHYSISGKIQSSLSFDQKPDIILLYGFDKPSLILVNAHCKLLEITDLDGDEYEELCQLLHTT